ncbi:hypothetical protein B0H11DRAFT_1902840 [Mycena galericulata]|nr:hypothetical protein B0H11DRAFT_1902840 [Mycena galericulata]
MDAPSVLFICVTGRRANRISVSGVGGQGGMGARRRWFSRAGHAVEVVLGGTIPDCMRRPLEDCGREFEECVEEDLTRFEIVVTGGSRGAYYSTSRGPSWPEGVRESGEEKDFVERSRKLAMSFGSVKLELKHDSCRGEYQLSPVPVQSEDSRAQESDRGIHTDHKVDFRRPLLVSVTRVSGIQGQPTFLSSSLMDGSYNTPVYEQLDDREGVAVACKSPPALVRTFETMIKMPVHC